MLDPMKCIAKVANKMRLNERITRQAMGIMHEAIKKEATTGKILWVTCSYMSYINNNIKGRGI